MSSEKVVTRFAPSPTGNLHIGGVRTALFNYLFAKKNGGQFLLRIEDTDKERSTKAFEKNILDGLNLLGLKWDGEIVRQSERTEIYKKYLQKLLDEGKIFVSKETEVKEGGRAEVIRFKNPNKKIKFDDIIRGEVEFDTTELGDFVIAKSMDEPIFHFANVVDDFEMGVNRVIRGEDHISNTPRQILIGEAIGAPRLIYAHLPLILAPDRSKLSKRHGAVSLVEYMENGYLPEALINFLALLGWNPGGDKEIFSLAELVEKFDLSKVQKSGAIFNVQKLDWINQQYVRSMNYELRITKIKEELEKAGIKDLDKKILEKIDSVAVERISRFGEIKEMADRGELNYFFKAPEFPKEKLLWSPSHKATEDQGKDEKDFIKTKKHLEYVLEKISAISEKELNKDSVKNSIWEYAEKEGRGNVLWPMRYSLSGMEKSPDPFTLTELLGKEETISRLKKAINLLG
ncbi:MAG: glutamate--tRNA ligase [Candidatus Paceibacterota bacterium]